MGSASTIGQVETRRCIFNKHPLRRKQARPIVASDRTRNLKLEHLEPRRLLSFSVGSDSPVSAYPNSVADFNGDGRADFTSPSADGHKIRITLANAIGTFTLGQQLLSEWPVSSIDAGDMNGDGKIDLVANGVVQWGTVYNGCLQIFAGNGDGTFQARQLAAVPGPLFPPHWSTSHYATTVTIADVDADGKADLVAACRYDYPNLGWDPDYPSPPTMYSGNYLAVLRGNGGGTFITSFVGADNPDGIGIFDVEPHDLNGDGKLDLVLDHVLASWDRRLDVLLGAGDGTFSAGPSNDLPDSAGSNETGLALADLNADAKVDFATTGPGVTVGFGDGNGGFAPHVNYPVGAPWSGSVATADFNRDGHPDLLVGGRNTVPDPGWTDGKVSVLLNNRAGGFGSPLVFSCGPNSNYSGPLVVAADVNGDTFPDIATISFDYRSYPYPANVRLVINDGDWPIKNWIGPASGGNWSTAANWSPGGVPIASDLVAISASTVTLSASATVASLTLTSGASLALASNGDHMLRIATLFIRDESTLDLNDNDLMLDYAGQSQLAPTQSLINAARAGGAWNGTGITSTAAKNNAQRNTTLGVIEATEFKSIYGAAATFGGQTIDTTAVLVKYTYYGDTDFNGVVDFDDYGRTDAGFRFGRSGWLNGDFDGSGFANFNDYSLIDLAFNTQGSALRDVPTSDWKPGNAAVVLTR